MIPEKKVANAMSGKTARACDCCIRRRARWYCPADDAFLCQVCDGSVHSANPLAQRHDRVRLKTASLKRSSNPHRPVNLPSWHRGLTRKPRTPRHGKSGQQGSKSSEESTGPNPLSLIVPELGADETTSSQDDESEDQLLYRVPIYDPFMAELCSSSTTSSSAPPPVEGFSAVKTHMIKSPSDEYLPSDMDLEQFAADVETLLGKGLDDEEAYGIEQLGLLDCIDINTSNNISTHTYNNNNDEDDDNDEENNNNPIDNFGELPAIKAEDGTEELVIPNGREMIIEGGTDDMAFREPFELSFDYDDHDFPSTCQDQEDQKGALVEPHVVGVPGDYDQLCNLQRDDDDDDKENKEGVKRRKILLRLDYEAISNAWGTNHGSPWMNGQRPEIVPGDCWPHCMGTCGLEMHNPLYGDHHQMGALGGHGVIGDLGREARVSRYREKRRTRLFAKKIRYEVRKLNAEKRPRMKGRFVKRSSFAPASATASFPLRSK